MHSGWRLHLQRFDLVMVVALLCASGLLLIPNLGHRPLWDDEAEVALLGRTILQTGLPVAWDGRNFLSYQDGDDVNDRGVFTFIPWVENYLAALSLGLFGEGTFQARLPFAVLGMLCAPLLYLALLGWTGDRRTSLLGAGLLALSAPFLLFAQNCRYYAPAMLFATAALALLPSLGRTRWCAPLMGLVLALSFYTHPMIAVALGAAVVAVSPLLDRTRQGLMRLGLALGLAAVLGLPWLMWTGAGGAAAVAVPTGAKLASTVVLFAGFLVQANRDGLMPVIFVAIIAADLVARPRGRRHDSPPAAFLILASVYTMAVAYLAPHQLSCETRFLSPMIPVFSGLMAVGLARVWAWKPVAGGMLLALTVLTNLPSLAGLVLHKGPRLGVVDTGSAYELRAGLAIRSPLANYLMEIIRPPASPYTPAIEALRALERDDPLVLVSPRFAAKPLMFYTRCRFLRTARADRLAQRPALLARLPRYVYDASIEPDVIVIFGRPEPARLAGIDLTRYDTRFINRFVDPVWLDMTRPELSGHAFKTPSPQGRPHGVFILTRMAPRRD